MPDLMQTYMQYILPYLGSIIGTYMLFRMAFVDWKLRANPLVILVGMVVEAISIGVGVYTTIINPQTTGAIFGWTAVSIAIGLLGPAVADRLDKLITRDERSAAAVAATASDGSDDAADSDDS
jgi:hypothetical protein